MRPGRRSAITAGAALALLLIANLPTSTSVGGDFVVTTHQIPLYEKAIAFVDRDIQLRRISGTAVAGSASEGDRVERLLRWAHDNVRPQPASLPVVDDHIWNIIVRGYGNADQAADVFATLAGYQGIPATLIFPRRADGSPVYAVAYAYVGGGWRVYDVRGGFALRMPDGRLATVDEARADPAVTGGLPVAQGGAGGLTYTQIAALLPPVPERLRPYDQMPLLRVWQELTALFRR